MNERNRALVAWYRSEGRDLPWRRHPDPWWVLVSEVMAQQTQMARVVPAFERFIDRFPTPGDLAAADLSELLLIWDGLGYQRRAVNLRKAAADIAGDGWPTDVEGLRRLPGVGPYTAAAVACFAFGAVVPAVDTNLKRVLSRWTGEALEGAALTERASEMVDTEAPSAWNQAIMDLGATICRPRSPACDACPVETWCSDPSVYVPPPRQSRYEGSVRQARATILKTLATRGPTPLTDLTHDQRTPALAALAREGLITVSDGTVHLVG